MAESTKTMDYEFNWKYGDFEISTTRPFGGGEPYIELVKWETDTRGKPYCFTLAYWHRDDEGWELRFVGNRPLKYIAEIDVSPIWKQLYLAQEMLQDAFTRNEEWRQ